MPKEKVAVAAIKRFLARLPGPAVVRKLADRFTRGYPDLQTIAAWDGELILLEIECKSPTGKLSALQELDAAKAWKAIGTLRRGKYIRVAARSVAEVKAALRQWGLHAMVDYTEAKK